MSSLSSILSTAKQSLSVQQQGIASTSQNVSNVNTEGYSRTKIDIRSNTDPTTGLGAGVKVNSIIAMRDSFVEKQILEEESRSGSFESQARVMQQVEPLYDETFGQGIDQSLTEFFNSFRQLSNNPMGTAERANVKSKGELVVEQFKRGYKGLSRIQDNLADDIQSKLTEANNYAEEVAKLNRMIQQSEVDETQKANDFRDKRQVILRKLANVLGLNTFESDGHTNVLVAGGKGLVDGVNAGKFQLQGDRIMFTDSSRVSSEDITDKIKNEGNGYLGGLLKVRDESIVDFKNNLDKMAFKLSSTTSADSFNSLHKQGFNIIETGNAGATSNNLTFFNSETLEAGAAERLTLSATVESSIGNIAASDTTGEKGNNKHALKLADFQNTQLSFTTGTTTKTATLVEVYREDVAKVASETAKTLDFVDFQTSIMNQLENFREQVSGVSIDDELTNMIAFQRAYEASARVIRTVDKLIDNILQLR